MNMKTHILAAMRDQLAAWSDLLASLSTTQLTASLQPSNWSVKIVIAHLMTWQQRSAVHFEAVLQDRDPQFPDWLSGDDPDAPGNADRVNAWVYTTFVNRSWSEVHRAWQAGYTRLIELAGQVDEIDLLAFERYAWLHGYSLADILISSYDHHKEHFENLQEWLQEHPSA